MYFGERQYFEGMTQKDRTQRHQRWKASINGSRVEHQMKLRQNDL